VSWLNPYVVPYTETAASAATRTTPGTANTQVGDLVLIWIGLRGNTGNSAVSTVTDLAGNTYHLVEAPGSGVQNTVQALYYTVAEFANAANTFSVTPTVSCTVVFEAVGYTGSASGVALDQHVSATNTGTNPASGNTGITAEAGELVVGGETNATNGPASGQAFSPATSITILTDLDSAVTGQGTHLSVSWQVSGGTGTQSFSATDSNAVWTCICATFLPASAPRVQRARRVPAGAYSRLVTVLGRVLRGQPPAPAAVTPTPPPLPGIRAIQVKGPLPPGRVIRPIPTNLPAPLRPTPRPVVAVTVKGPVPPGAARRVLQRLAPLLPVPRPILERLVKGPVPPGAVRHTSALAQLRANPRAFLVALVKGPIPPGRVLRVLQRLAPLRPQPRAIVARLVRGPIPPGAVVRVLQRLAALRPNPRPILRQLVRGPIPPGAVRQITQRLSPLRPAPRAILRALVRGPITPGAVVRVAQKLAPLIPVPRPIRTLLDRNQPHPFAGRVLQVSQRLAPLRALPRAIQALLDRNQPHAFPGRVIRVLQKLAPSPPIPAVRPLQSVIDRNEPKPFPGRVIELRPHTAPLMPVPRALVVLIDRNEPKPFGGHVIEVRPHLAPFIAIPAPPPIAVHLDVQPFKVPLAGGRVIVVIPKVAPLKPFVFHAPLLTGTRRHPTRRNIITWPTPPPQPNEVH